MSGYARLLASFANCVDQPNRDRDRLRGVFIASWLKSSQIKLITALFKMSAPGGQTIGQAYSTQDGGVWRRRIVFAG